MKTYSKLRKNNQEIATPGTSFHTSSLEKNSKFNNWQLKDQIETFLVEDKLRRRGQMLRAPLMKNPFAYQIAKSKKRETMGMLNDIKIHVINGRKREDEESALANAKGIPKLRINNASFLREEAEPSSEIADLYGAYGGKTGIKTD